jgi:hypothetical protein
MLLTRPKSLISRGEDRQTQTILDGKGRFSASLAVSGFHKSPRSPFQKGEVTHLVKTVLDSNAIVGF